MSVRAGTVMDRRNDVLRVTIEDVDLTHPLYPVAVGRDASGGEIDINLSKGVGDRIVVPKVGEHWYVGRPTGYEWQLTGKVDETVARAGGTPTAPRDGNAPSSSPAAVVSGGAGYLLVSWDPIVNPDPVT